MRELGGAGRSLLSHFIPLLLQLTLSSSYCLASAGRVQAGWSVQYCTALSVTFSYWFDHSACNVFVRWSTLVGADTPIRIGRSPTNGTSRLQTRQDSLQVRLPLSGRRHSWSDARRMSCRVHVHHVAGLTSFRFTDSRRGVIICKDRAQFGYGS